MKKYTRKEGYLSSRKPAQEGCAAGLEAVIPSGTRAHGLCEDQWEKSYWQACCIAVRPSDKNEESLPMNWAAGFLRAEIKPAFFMTCSPVPNSSWHIVGAQ